MKRNLITIALMAVLAMGVLNGANAQTMPPIGAMQGMPAASKPGADMVDGEVRKIDKGANKITLRHAEIPNLEMPGMTMVFRVKDPAMLDTVQVGDKVKFQAQNMGGALVVTELQPVK